MSLVKKAASGFLWTTLGNIGSRVITIVSTFVLTRFLDPDIQGRVNVAYILVSTLGALTTFGITQYIAAHPKADRSTSFHASVLFLGTGLVAMLVAYGVANPASAWLNNPGAAAFVPGFAISHMLDRWGTLQRNILIRNMEFRQVGIRTALGEIAFGISTVAFAVLGAGGHSIVYGNWVRAVVAMLYLARVTALSDYFEIGPFNLGKLKDILRFGIPINIAGVFHSGALTWDNLFISWRFGDATVGVYNYAYKLADLPASAVGEQINDVLVPTFARVDDPAQRSRGLVRAASLMGLVVFPLCMGLGAVAKSAVETLLAPSYYGVAPLLTVMSVFGAFRSFGSIAIGFLQVAGRVRVQVMTDVILVITLLGSMSVLSTWGPVAAATGVGVAFFVHTMVLFIMIRPLGVRSGEVFLAVLPPALACVPLVLSVIGIREVLGAFDLAPVISLITEIVVGAIVYVVSALVIARKASKDLLSLLSSMMKKRRGAPAPEAQA